MSPKTFLGLPADHTDPERAAAVILPVPYDGTATWKKGSARGPDAILEASAQVELYDVETASEPWRRGIATLDAIRAAGPPENLVEAVKRAAAPIFGARQILALLGGDHAVSIGAMQAAAVVAPSLTILQIDAHADTREEYDGSPFNHACVMARARELCPIVQVGIRSVAPEEVERLDRDRIVWAHEIPSADDSWIERVVGLLGDDVYVTVDLDAFDPSIMPATGTPEPDGLSWRQVNSLFGAVARRSNVVGFDLVELLPGPGQHACDFFAAKLAYRFLAMVFAARYQPST